MTEHLTTTELEKLKRHAESWGFHKDADLLRLIREVEELRAALRDADRVIAHDANPLGTMDEGYVVRPLREAALERHKARAALGDDHA